MSPDDKRWALKAYELKFQQLEIARKQAESWRAALTGLTSLLGAVLVIKGKDSLADLNDPYRWIVMVLLGAALVLLVTATMLAVSAAAGNPGGRILLTGEHLRSWSTAEVVRIERFVAWASLLTLTAVTAVAVAVGITWTAPAKSGAVLVTVVHRQGTVCGELSGSAQGRLLVRSPRTKSVASVPLVDLIGVQAAEKC
ncbi:hypothetical protein [Actinocorallia libanotica]|uniref:Uncharacterized protein n=1 Tax=Actinocorallia libanotica TaxID=46162 RepID=A0ABN1R5Y8_9ACTN